MRSAEMYQNPALILCRPFSQLTFGVTLQFGFSRGAVPRMPKLLLPPFVQLLKVTSRPLYLSTSESCALQRIKTSLVLILLAGVNSRPAGIAGAHVQNERGLKNVY